MKLTRVICRFFSTYDTDRPSLQSVYAPLCTFSLSADTAVPVRSRVRKIGSHGDRKFPNQHKLDWKDYLSSGSRNLLRTKRADRRFATIQMSPADVTASITTLPKTQHPLSDASKFVFDAFLMPGLLPATPEGGDGTAIFASVHGEFTELPSKGVRSFSRTFLLAPASPGSKPRSPRCRKVRRRGRAARFAIGATNWRSTGIRPIRASRGARAGPC